ncbi:FeoC-like transcriptional regulator [Sutterella sp.]|uniref:FeoC-like transcriptional regulator n=1 Tax=Sutterella sp. TaxID=1981025 RepID=UPI0026DFC835|nr:FeoC-like transcriptional regulator [Sutterella sp.]MDO5531134.1 FeoC-like transcriptional regulator [Sutterella sp.]
MINVKDVRALIAERPGVTLRDLSWHFKVSPVMMELMLDKLIERGDIEKFNPPACCGGDCGCHDEGHPKAYRLTFAARQALAARG